MAYDLHNVALGKVSSKIFWKVFLYWLTHKEQ